MVTNPSPNYYNQSIAHITCPAVHAIQISSAEEMSLSANQGRAEMEKKRLVWKAEGSPQGAKAARGGAVDPAGLVVELGPMEIRTFVISFL